MTASIHLLLLTDGRAPVGAYAHSFGLEPAVAAGDVGDLATLAAFVAARLRTTGMVDACFAAAVCDRARLLPPDPALAVVAEVDAHYDARVAAPAVRDRSRELGRHLLRLAERAWPAQSLAAARRRWPQGLHQPAGLGLVAASAGLDPTDAATCALYGLASALASAGLRLLGLDPVEVHAAQARLADTCAALAARATALATGPLADLPACATPLADARAQRHADASAGRLFAS